jgi:hypothetical protein
MNSQPTNWVPGILVLAFALFVAAVFILSARKKGSAAPEKSAPEDLDERYRSLLLMLKEHAASKHLANTADWEREQQRLEQAAAQVLKERASQQHQLEKATARAEKAASHAQRNAQNATLKGALIGGGSVAFVAVLAFLLTQNSQPRQEPNPTPVAAQGRSREEVTQEVERLKKQADAHPEDTDVLAQVGGELIKLRAYEEAYPIITKASGLDPFHLQTRVYRAVMKAVDGAPLPALDELEHLGENYEGTYKARLYAGLIALELQQPGRALKQLEAFLNEAPPNERPPFIAMSVQQLKEQLQNSPKAAPP